MTKHVIVSVENKTMQLRLNRPEKKNALTVAMYEALTDAFIKADRDPQVRDIAITGTGDAFTSGNDLGDFLESPLVGEESPVGRFLAALSQAAKPVVAGVNGLAVGIGVTMLLHCDLVYAAERAVFQMPFVNHGLVPEAASSLLLPRLAGHQRAAQLLLLGDRFDAAAAQQVGLVNHICPMDLLKAELKKTCAVLADKPPAALRLTKALLKGNANAILERLSEEREIFARQLQSPEAREAMQAFVEKRRPDFSRFV